MDHYLRNLEPSTGFATAEERVREKARILRWVASQIRSDATFVSRLNLEWSGVWRSRGRDQWQALLEAAEGLLILCACQESRLAAALSDPQSGPPHV